jgi:hypothetical protein
MAQTREISLKLILGLFLFPFVFFFALFRPGYSTGSRLGAFFWCFGWLFILGIIVGPQPESKSPPSLQHGASGDQVVTPRPVIWKHLFELLKPGVQTYSFLAGQIGPGELISSSEIGGIKTENYVWRNPDGSDASMIFQNDVLVMKSQSGLQ